MSVDHDRRAGGADPQAVVREFWRLMATNDFAAVGAVLADDFVLDWPQSNERIRGRDRFARMNAEYPAAGPWRFEVLQLVAGDGEVVTRVHVTDGEIQAEAISFFAIARGLITRIVEYWPEPYAPATDRAHLTEPIA